MEEANGLISRCEVVFKKGYKKVKNFCQEHPVISWMVPIAVVSLGVIGLHTKPGKVKDTSKITSALEKADNALNCLDAGVDVEQTVTTAAKNINYVTESWNTNGCLVKLHGNRKASFQALENAKNAGIHVTESHTYRSLSTHHRHNLAA